MIDMVARSYDVSGSRSYASSSREPAFRTHVAIAVRTAADRCSRSSDRAFARLGFWQLHRADEKQALLAQYAAGQNATVELTRRERRHAAALSAGAYARPLRSRASDPARQHAIAARPAGLSRGHAVRARAAAAGCWSIAAGCRWVRRVAELPDIAVGENASATSSVASSTLPRAGITLEDERDPAAMPGRRCLSFPQHGRARASRSDRRLINGLLLLDPAQPDGYERAWASAGHGCGPERHIAYAVQWFAFAAGGRRDLRGHEPATRTDDDRARTAEGAPRAFAPTGLDPGGCLLCAAAAAFLLVLRRKRLAPAGSTNHGELITSAASAAGRSNCAAPQERRSMPEIAARQMDLAVHRRRALRCTLP